MAFDLSTAKPVEEAAAGGFDLSTATPVEPPQKKKDEKASGMWNLYGPTEALLHSASGAMATPIAGLLGLGAAANPSADATETIGKVQDFLTYKPQTESGDFLTKVTDFIPEMMSEGANWAGEKATDLASMVPGLRGAPAAAYGTGLNMALQAIPAMLTHKLAGPAGEKITTATADATKQSILNAISDRVTNRLKGEGFKLPPAQVNPTLANRAAEGFGGGPQLANRLSVENQPKVDSLARKAIGVSDSIPLSVEVLNSIRKENGAAHAEIQGLEEPLHATENYLSAISKIGTESAKAQAEAPEVFAERTKQIDSLKSTLAKEAFSPGAALELMQEFRDRANSLKSKGKDPDARAMRRAYGNAVEALDGLLKDGLDEQGRGDLYDAYKTERPMIAKTYAIQAALDRGTGHIDAKKLSTNLDKDVPLTDEIRTIALAAKNYPSAVKRSQAAKGDPFTNWDLVVPTRIPARKIAASDWYQKRFVKPPARGLSSTHEAILRNLADPRLAPILAALQAQHQQPPDETGTR